MDLAQNSCPVGAPFKLSYGPVSFAFPGSHAQGAGRTHHKHPKGQMETLKGGQEPIFAGEIQA
eukprot:630585-Amphidinium_carterae.1